MAGSVNNDNGSTATYFPEDILLNILKWLPIASCIARFRCVCRSWRALLSDPKVIRNIIFSQTSDEQKRLQVLITGIRNVTDHSTLFYSVYSYETLRPIKEEWATVTGGSAFSRVVGCCDGIFCISHTTRAANGNYVHNIILWNPATSETKIIPPCPYNHPCHSSSIVLFLRAERIGFGYDPKTNDYKVVRVLEFEEGELDDDDQFDYDPSEFYHGPTPLIFTEVYSLRNDSWKMLNVDAHSVEGRWIYDLMAHKTVDLRQQLDISQNEKCYWFRREESPGISAVISFDMSTEMFELITIPQPSGLAHHDQDKVDYPYGIRSGYDHENAWEVRSCFMLKKGVFLVTFAARCYRCDISSLPDDETWVLLKCGVAESWTKLYTWTQSYDADRLEVWKDGTYICACKETLESIHSNVSVCDIETGETIRKKIEIEGMVGGFQAHIFAPTQVSMSQLV